MGPKKRKRNKVERGFIRKRERLSRKGRGQERDRDEYGHRYYMYEVVKKLKIHGTVVEHVFNASS